MKLEGQARRIGLEVNEAPAETLSFEDIPDEGLCVLYQSNAAEIDGEIRLQSGIRSCFLIHRMQNEIAVNFDGATTLLLQCGRCLREFDEPIEFRCQTMLLPAKTLAGNPAEQDLNAEDLGITFYEQPELRYFELLREEIVLSIPIQPICDEACKGLCAHCGANLSEQPCDCRNSQIDPRWAILAHLLPEESGTETSSD